MMHYHINTGRSGNKITHRVMMLIVLISILGIDSSFVSAMDIRHDFIWDKVSIQCAGQQPFTAPFSRREYRIALPRPTASKDCDVIVHWKLKLTFQNTDYGRQVMAFIYDRASPKAKSYISNGQRIGTPRLDGQWGVQTRVRFDRIVGKSFGFILQYNQNIKVAADQMYRKFVRVRPVYSRVSNTGIPILKPPKRLVDHVISGQDLMWWTGRMGYGVRIRSSGDVSGCSIQSAMMEMRDLSVIDGCSYDLFQPSITLGSGWSYRSAMIAGNAKFKQIMIQPRKGEQNLYLRIQLSGKVKHPMFAGSWRTPSRENAELVHVILKGPEGVNWHTAIGRR